MRGKKAQIFAVYLTLITLFMCFVVVLFYLYQNNEVSNSLVSPVDLMLLQDKQTVFEVQEKSVILTAASDALKSSSWGTQEFIDKFKERFYFYFMAEEQKQMRDYLFSDLMFKDKQISSEIFSDLETGESSQKNFFEQAYGFGFENKDEKFRVSRQEVGKQVSFMPYERIGKINFPVDVKFVHDKTYILTKQEIEEINKLIETSDVETEVKTENPFSDYSFKDYFDALNSKSELIYNPLFPFETITLESLWASRDAGTKGDAYEWGTENKVRLNDFKTVDSGYILVTLKNNFKGKVVFDVWVDNEDYFTSDNPDFSNEPLFKEKISDSGRAIRVELSAGDIMVVDVDGNHGESFLISVFGDKKYSTKTKIGHGFFAGVFDQNEAFISLNSVSFE